MFRKVIFSVFFAILVFAAGTLPATAQTAPVSGTVVLKKEDGTSVPVANALIEVYRTDVKAGAPSVKTGKNGDFAFAGLMVGGTYSFAVSGPNLAPVVYPAMRAGMEGVVLTVTPGDGRKFTEAEARSSVPATAQPTADQKKAQAEYEAQVKAVNEKNAKAQKSNEIIAAALKAGNDAYVAKNYDVAVTQYEQGIAADPDFVGTAPVLLNNRSAALVGRATDSYNRAVKSADPTAAVADKLKAKEDLKAAADGLLRAWTLLTKAPAAEVTDKTVFETTKGNTLRGAKDLFKIAARTEQVDPAVVDAAKVLIPAYISFESDPAKKNEAGLAIADLYRVTGEYQLAIDAYKKVLETSPDNPDALAGAGLCLFALGAVQNNDKALYQEGANYLQKYVSAAPDGHKYKADAVAILEQLKNEQNVKPQKLPTGGKKRGN